MWGEERRKAARGSGWQLLFKFCMWFLDLDIQAEAPSRRRAQWQPSPRAEPTRVPALVPFATNPPHKARAHKWRQCRRARQRKKWAATAARDIREMRWHSNTGTPVSTRAPVTRRAQRSAAQRSAAQRSAANGGSVNWLVRIRPYSHCQKSSQATRRLPRPCRSGMQSPLIQASSCFLLAIDRVNRRWGRRSPCPG